MSAPGLREKLNDSPAGKALVIFAAVVVVAFAIYMGLQASSDGSRVVGPQEVVSDGQKAINAIRANPNIPEAAKQSEIAHIQAEVDQASGKSGQHQNAPNKS